MKIDRNLNLVIPVDRDDGTIAYVHSTPISRPVFEANYLLIAKAFSKLYVDGGLGITAGPRIAAMVLRDVAQGLGVDLDTALFSEVRRLTNFVVPTGAGWETVPYQEAVDKSLVDRDDVAEVDNALAFFTVTCAMHRKPVAQAMMDGAVMIWGGQTTSLPVTGFITSLKTSTTDGSTGGKETVSSIPH